MLDLRREFPSQWHRFLNPTDPANGNVFQLEIMARLFRMLNQEKTLKVSTIWLLAHCTDGQHYTAILSPPLAAADTFELVQVNQFGRLHFDQKEVSLTVDLVAPPEKWRLKMTKSGSSNELLENNPAEVHDLFLVFGYHWEES